MLKKKKKITLGYPYPLIYNSHAQDLSWRHNQVFVPRCINYSLLQYQICSQGKAIQGAGAIAQWSRALAALREDSGSVPSTHMVGNNHPVPRDLVPSSGHMYVVHKYARNNNTPKIKINKTWKKNLQSLTPYKQCALFLHHEKCPQCHCML